MLDSFEKKNKLFSFVAFWNRNAHTTNWQKPLRFVSLFCFIKAINVDKINRKKEILLLHLRAQWAHTNIQKSMCTLYIMYLDSMYIYARNRSLAINSPNAYNTEITLKIWFLFRFFEPHKISLLFQLFSFSVLLLLFLLFLFLRFQVLCLLLSVDMGKNIDSERITHVCVCVTLTRPNNTEVVCTCWIDSPMSWSWNWVLRIFS